MVRILVIGAASFIGFHLSQRLLTRGGKVMGVDNLNHYYDVAFKQEPLVHLLGKPGFRFQLMHFIKVLEDCLGMKAEKICFLFNQVILLLLMQM